MVAGKKSIFLTIFMLLIASVAVSAAPTIRYCDNFSAVCPSTNAHILDISKTSTIIELYNSAMEAIGAKIPNPPVEYAKLSFGGSETSPRHAAVFMVAIGFLCLSLVINRRLQLAIPAAPLCLSQRGFHSTPRSASKMSEINFQRKTLAKTACLFRLEDFRRLRSDIESTQYINLHNLAGRTYKRIFLPHTSKRTKLQQERNINEVPQLTITHFSPLLYPALIHMARRAEQNLSFSPGFIFVRLARGPPNPA